MTIRVNDQSMRNTEFFGHSHRGKVDGDHHNRFASFMRGQGGINIDGGSGDDHIFVNGSPEGFDSNQGNQDPVAANENGSITGDPHFVGGDGGKYDVQGEAGKTYDLLSDDGLQFRGRFDGWGDGITVVGETGLGVKGANGETSEISFSKDGKAQIDGQAMEQGREYTLADGGTAKLEGKNLTVTTGEGYTINQTAVGDGDRAYINTNVSTGADGVDHGTMPDGLLGQTFDADNVARNGKTGAGAQGEGALEGVVTDYEVGGLFDKSHGPHGGGVNVDGGSGDDEIVISGQMDGPINVEGGSGDDVIVIGPQNPSESPADPVAANETGKIWGDPHFVGGDGGTYDVQGEAGKIYDLLSDEGLDLRGRFDAWKDGVTVVGETGLTVGDNPWNSDNVNFRKDGTAQINGQQMEQGQEYQLADGGTAKLEGNTLTITTAEGYTIKQTAQGSGDGAYIDVDVNTGANGVDNGKMPGGLLGQTFDADNEARKGTGAQGEGAIEGNIGDYERNALDPINDNRGQNSPAEESSNEVDDFMDQIQKFIDQIMKMVENRFGQDPQSIPQPKQETNTDAGSGDDRVEILREGNHNVDLGSGDDEAYVNFGEDATDNSATIHGGSGEDKVTLAGKRSDYTVERGEEYTTYNDKNGNSVKVANDVEQVEFEDGDWIIDISNDGPIGNDMPPYRVAQ